MTGSEGAHAEIRFLCFLSSLRRRLLAGARVARLPLFSGSGKPNTSRHPQQLHGSALHVAWQR